MGLRMTFPKLQSIFLRINYEEEQEESLASRLVRKRCDWYCGMGVMWYGFQAILVVTASPSIYPVDQQITSKGFNPETHKGSVEVKLRKVTI